MQECESSLGNTAKLHLKSVTELIFGDHSLVLMGSITLGCLCQSAFCYYGKRPKTTDPRRRKHFLWLVVSNVSVPGSTLLPWDL